MDQNFQTSFIPKKPLAEDVVVRSGSVNIFLILSIFAFFAVILGSGGLYFYKGVLAKQVDTMSTNLNLAKGRFEPTEITRLQTLDKRLNAAEELLSNHVAISQIFTILQQYTLKTIRYTKFSSSIADPAGLKVNVKMSGQAIGYRSVALQADMFSKNKNIIDPSFTNLSLDNKGNVLFDLDFSVDPTFVNYKQVIMNNSTSQ
ncbi:MAG: hypothetical protein NTZ44_00705 [Candidatus Nomurabacteria bacterium]|nr:hypothetical protein [Candidatus Nomurabacteria bacterium]